MKQLYIILSLLLSFYSSAFAQQDFREGYIVQNSDTIRGYVDYRGDRRSAQVTVFKKTPESLEQHFRPDAIQGYGFKAERKVFESKVIPSAGAGTEPQTLFLNALIKGKASIFYYVDAEQIEHYYLSKNNSPLIELLQQEYIQKDPATGKTYKVKSKAFVDTLRNAFSDCGNLKTAQFKRLNLSQVSLTAIAREYNKCVAPASMVHEQETKGIILLLGPVTTVSGSNLKFSGNSYLSRASFTDKSVSFGGGVAINATLPKMNEKLSFQLELLYIPSKYTALLEETNGKETKTYDATFDLTYLKLPVQLRYTYPRGQLRPYINAGILVGYTIKDENQVIVTNTYRGSYTNSNTYPAIPGNDITDGFRNIMEGVTAGAGLTYPLFKGNISLEARYEINTGVSALPDIGSSTHIFYTLLGYSF